MVVRYELKKEILHYSSKFESEIIQWRRHFHANPELSFQERETGEYITKILDSIGIPNRKIANTGVCGKLIGGKPGPTIALRADMDALPVEEMNEVDYRSNNKGVMHACGHDAHCAILLGVAKVMYAMRDLIQGSIVFIFQPAEEKAPGGAIDVIDDGVFEAENIKAIAGLHIYTNYPVGTLGVKAGPLMAAADSFQLTIKGVGGHGAYPHQSVDPIVMSAQVINALQTIPSRLTRPTDPVVVTIGKINGGSAPNIIPDQVVMEGTCRSFDEETRRRVKELIAKLTEGVVNSYGGKYQLKFNPGYPSVVNDKDMANIVRSVGQEVLGASKTMSIAEPSMGGEDFAFYCKKVPGVFIQLGAGAKEGPTYPLHHPKFNIDERALVLGVRILALTSLKAVEAYKGDEGQ